MTVASANAAVAHADLSHRPTIPHLERTVSTFVQGMVTAVDLTIERSLPVLTERSQPDVLFRLGSFRMAVIAFSSLGGSDVCPTGCRVDGAGVARGLDDGLDEHGRDVVALGPVPGQEAAHDGEDVRAEVRESTHGRIRKRGLSTTSGRFFSRISGDHPMTLLRGASFQAPVEKPSMATEATTLFQAREKGGMKIVS